MRLRYILPALADLNAILDHIAAHSPQVARRVQARIKALSDLIALSQHRPPHEVRLRASVATSGLLPVARRPGRRSEPGVLIALV